MPHVIILRALICRCQKLFTDGNKYPQRTAFLLLPTTLDLNIIDPECDKEKEKKIDRCSVQKELLHLFLLLTYLVFAVLSRFISSANSTFLHLSILPSDVSCKSVYELYPSNRMIGFHQLISWGIRSQINYR